MKPERLSELVTLYQGDCLDVLRGLPDGSFDAVITDPPYGISYATNFTVGGVGASWLNRQIVGDETTEARDVVLSWARERELLWACFGSWKMPKPEGIRGVLIWDKGPSFGMGDLSFPWKGSWEEIYIGGRGWSGNRDEGVLRGHLVHSHESQGRCHPTEKPVSLMREIVRKLPRDAHILDPFAGSGTTAIAAAMEGRHCTLIERDPAYCDIIRRRVATETAKHSNTLFGDLTKSDTPDLFTESNQ